MHAVAPDYCQSTGELAGSSYGATKSCTVKNAVLDEESSKAFKSFKNQTTGISAFQDLNLKCPIGDFLEKASTKCVRTWDS
jgi:hypothetical protein